MDVSSFAGLLTSIASGAGTFLIVQWLLTNLEQWQGLTRQVRFFSIYALSFALATGAYGLQVYAAYAVFSWDALLAVCVAAFATSQALWGIFKAGK
jgi:drug/metabolite transporter superfamily protein YnfA